MRKLISFVLLVVLGIGIIQPLRKIPFGTPKTKVGRYYVNNGVKDTGATNIVTAVVLNYRGFDTLGEVTVLFIAALGLGAVLTIRTGKRNREKIEKASIVLSTGCNFLFPFILLLGAYIFIHGHLTPGGGFQGGAIIASAYLLVYLGCRGKRISENASSVVESLAGLIFVTVGLIGLAVGGYFLLNFLPKGIPNSLFSAGIIPIIYVAIGLKVGSELAGIIDHLMEDTE